MNVFTFSHKPVLWTSWVRYELVLPSALSLKTACLSCETPSLAFFRLEMKYEFIKLIRYSGQDSPILVDDPLKTIITNAKLKSYLVLFAQITFYQVECITHMATLVNLGNANACFLISNLLSVSRTDRTTWTLKAAHLFSSWLACCSVISSFLIFFSTAFLYKLSASVIWMSCSYLHFSHLNLGLEIKQLGCEFFLWFSLALMTYQAFCIFIWYL